jgi:adenylate cyclase
MESHGTPGRIQITRSTYDLLAGEFECEPRGTIDVKGKGEIEAWYLIRPLDDRNAESAAALGVKRAGR